MSDSFEDVSSVEVLASMVSNLGESRGVFVGKQVSLRIYVHYLAQVDALASRAGISRNAMVNRLLDVGLNALRSHLSDDVAKEVDEATGEACAKLMDSGLEAVRE